MNIQVDYVTMTLIYLNIFWYSNITYQRKINKEYSLPPLIISELLITKKAYSAFEPIKKKKKNNLTYKVAWSTECAIALWIFKLKIFFFLFILFFEFFMYL